MIRKAIAALAVVLALAAPASADFVLNGTSLTTNKQDLFPTPVGANPLNYITALDYNNVAQAAIDLRTHALNAPTTLVDGATITIDLSTPTDTLIVTLGGNRTVALSNLIAGRAFMLEIVQDATGSRTLTWPAAIHWSGGTAPTLTTTASKADVVSCKSFNGTSLLCTSTLNFTP